MSEYDLWNPLIWDILPGYRLLRARRRYQAPPSSTFSDVQPGDWGLHETDSVMFHWRVEPMLDPEIDLSRAWQGREEARDNDPIYRSQVQLWLTRVGELRKQLTTNRFGEGEHFEVAYDFVRACKRGGWHRLVHGDVYGWFLHRIASVIAHNSGYTDPQIDRWLLTLAKRDPSFKITE